MFVYFVCFFFFPLILSSHIRWLCMCNVCASVRFSINFLKQANMGERLPHAISLPCRIITITQNHNPLWISTLVVLAPQNSGEFVLHANPFIRQINMPWLKWLSICAFNGASTSEWGRQYWNWHILPYYVRRVYKANLRKHQCWAAGLLGDDGDKNKKQKQKKIRETEKKNRINELKKRKQQPTNYFTRHVDPENVYAIKFYRGKKLLECVCVCIVWNWATVEAPSNGAPNTITILVYQSISECIVWKAECRLEATLVLIHIER